MTKMNTGYVVYTEQTGELPTILAFEVTAEAAKAKAIEEAKQVGLEETPDPVHVDIYDDRDMFDVSDWLLFGDDYALGGDVVVKHGTQPK